MTFDVLLWVGSPSNPNIGTVPRTVTVIDSTHILVSAYNLYKYTCKELAEMHLYPSDYGLDCSCPNLFFPNIITPNGDSKNETFRIKDLPRGSTLTIFNRWGEAIFYSVDYYNYWNGDNAPDGVYYYILKTKTGEMYKGMVTLMR